jgi:hypothetical protein
MVNTSVLKHHINAIVEPLYDAFACPLDVREVGILSVMDTEATVRNDM